MPAQTKTQLKSFFQDQDVPSESQYIDLIDSMADGGTYGTGVITTGFSESTPGVLTAGDNAKRLLWSIPHFTEAEENAAVIEVYASAAHTFIHIGGQQTGKNSATFTKVWGAANNTTLGSVDTELAQFSLLGTHIIALAQGGGPTVGQIPAGYWGVWKDTTSGNTHVYTNDGGVLKKSPAFT